MSVLIFWLSCIHSSLIPGFSENKQDRASTCTQRERRANNEPNPRSSLTMPSSAAFFWAVFSDWSTIWASCEGVSHDKWGIDSTRWERRSRVRWVIKATGNQLGYPSGSRRNRWGRNSSKSKRGAPQHAPSFEDPPARAQPGASSCQCSGP